MEIKVLTFGKIATITGDTVLLRDATDTDSLQSALEAEFPGLKDTKYVMAVNKEIVQGNKLLNAGTEVALLPPFSGG